MQENEERILLDGYILLHEKNHCGNIEEASIIQLNDNSNSQYLKYDCILGEEIGVLTEFYPKNLTNIKRYMKTGTLCLYKDEKDFLCKQEKYFGQLEKLKKLAEDKAEFKKFIPEFEILESPQIASNNGTLYVWQKETETIQIHDSLKSDLENKNIYLTEIIKAFAGVVKNIMTEIGRAHV